MALEENIGHDNEQKVLLKLARNSVCSFLNRIENKDIFEYDGWLSLPLGAFVSIHSSTNELRGCIGRIQSKQPLYKLISELAISAASQDFRFIPVTKSELNQMVFEISVLSPLLRIYAIDEIIAGKHGIYIKKGNQSGTYLPQVLQETGWDIETFVGRCSRDKAGIGWDGWKDGELFVYTAEVFTEATKA